VERATRCGALNTPCAILCRSRAPCAPCAHCSRPHLQPRCAAARRSLPLAPVPTRARPPLPPLSGSDGGRLAGQMLLRAASSAACGGRSACRCARPACSAADAAPSTSGGTLAEVRRLPPPRPAAAAARRTPAHPPATAPAPLREGEDVRRTPRLAPHGRLSHARPAAAAAACRSAAPLRWRHRRCCRGAQRRTRGGDSQSSRVPVMRRYAPAPSPVRQARGPAAAAAAARRAARARRAW